MASVAGRRLPPVQVDCMWWKQGYCARGKTCYFRHDEAMAGVDNKTPDDASARGKGKGNGKEKAKVTSNLTEASATEREAPSSSTTTTLPADESSPTSAQICTICLETPETFGLLLNCDHVFCLECIRNWRSSTTAPLPSNDELKSTSKTCPMCRSHSDFIIPSSLFPLTPKADHTGDGEDTAKKEIVDRYLSRLKNIPCRYFKQSIEGSNPILRPKCKFGNSCHYAHLHPITREPYIFSEEELSRPRRRPGRNRARFLEEMAVMERVLADLGHESDSEDEWGPPCEGENDDFMFFEEGEFLGWGFGESSFGFDSDFGWEEFDYHYG